MPARPAPNATTPICEAAQLREPAGDAIPVGGAAWWAWLAAPGHSTFYLRTEAGAYTARRERRRGGDYWYAYARRGPKLRKAYLGRSAGLTWARLLAVAESLAGPPPAPPAPLVLRAKLGVPPLRAATVPRPRLTALLAGVRARPLTLISAPPGFGKTTLLCQWAALPHTGPLAWLSLDADDNDPRRFWSHVAAAVAAPYPTAAAAARPALAAPTFSGAAVASALFAALPPRAPLTLVLDDYHLIEAAEVHAGLAFALEHWPAAWRLIVASRADPTGLPLPRLRAQGRLTELRAADLRLTPAEAALFLDQAAGRAVPAAVAHALEAQTEGWAAALQLAALALPADEAAAPLPPAAQRHVFDYLAAEVLQRQPPAIQRFLLTTSILDRLSAELCAELVGDLPTGLLEQLEQRNLFLVPLDSERRWYRYHALFAEFLRARLAVSGADRPALHARAAAWLAAHGETAAASEHWLAAGDYARAAALIDRDAEALMAQGAIATIARRLAALPPATVQASAALSIWQAWCLSLSYQFDAVGPVLAHAEARLHRGAAYAATLPPDEARTVRYSVAAGLGQIAVIRAQVAYQQGDYSGTAEWAHTALTHLPASEPRMRSLVALTLGQAHQAAGDLPAADRALAEAAQRLAATQHPFIHLSILSAQAQLRAQQGQLHAAAALYRRARTWAQDHGGAALAAATALGLADLLREWNDLDAAAHLAAHLPLAELAGQAGHCVAGLLIQARVQQARGEAEAARANLAAAEALTQHSPAARAGAQVAAWQARLALAQGDLPAAQRWAAAAPAASALEHATQVRVWLADPTPEALAAVRARVGDLLPAAEAAGRGAQVIELRWLGALALAAGGDEAGALGLLGAALSLAAPEGYVRLFLDDGRPGLRLLRAFSLAPEHARRVSPRYLHTLLRAAGLSVPGEPDPAAPLGGRPLEPLSARERAVLRLLAEGWSNREIARQLGMAVGTAQWHTKRIYRKLDARNRTQAAAVARAWGLLG